ncbi:MAG TPA: hypothetical protein DHT39_13890 [Pantoea sp.]|nr:hypothetical protein [Pantoea sp.]
MNSHDPKRIVYAPARQYWRAFAYVMQLHENHYIKRAGVAGVRARAEGWRWSERAAFSGPLARRQGARRAHGAKKRATRTMVLRRSGRGQV